MSKRRQRTYQVMGIPDPAGGAPEGWTALGSFSPADHPRVVEALSERRIRGILRLLEMPGLFAESRSYLHGCLFHAYADFLIQQRHDQPTRRDGIGYGHALKGHSPDLAGYLAYLAEKAPGLAAFLRAPLPFCLREVERQRHTLIVAGSGAGKSVLMNALIHADRNRPRPPTSILIDPHGDLGEDVARSRALRDRETLVYLDPAFAPSHRFTVNFFDVRPSTPEERRSGRLSDEKIDRLAQIGVGIFEMIAGGEGSMTLNMRTLLYPCLCVLLDIQAGEHPYSIADLARFMDDARNEDLVARGQRARHQAHRIFFDPGPGGESGFHARSFRTTKLALYTRIQSLLNSRIFCDLAIGDGTSTIDLEDAINSRRAIVFNIAKNKVGDEVAVTFGKFLVGLIQAYCMLRPQNQRVPVYLYLDEFHNFVSPSIKELFTELRKFALHLTIAQQYEGQEGNRDIATAIAANTAVKIVGRTADPGSAVKMATKVLVDEADIRRLKIGQFFIRAGGDLTCKLQVPADLLAPENRLGTAEWQAFRDRQLATHYRPRRSPQEAEDGVSEPETPDEAQTPLSGLPGASGGAPVGASSTPESPPPAPENVTVIPPSKNRRPKFRLPGQS